MQSSHLLTIPWTVKVSQIFPDVIALRVLRHTSQILFRMFLYSYLSNIVLMIRLGPWVLKKKTADIKCHFLHIIPVVYILSTWFVTSKAHFVTWLRWWSKVAFTPSTFYTVLLEESYNADPTLKEWELHSISLRAVSI